MSAMTQYFHIQFIVPPPPPPRPPPRLLLLHGRSKQRQFVERGIFRVLQGRETERGGRGEQREMGGGTERGGQEQREEREEQTGGRGTERDGGRGGGS